MPLAFICITTEPDFMVDVVTKLKTIPGVKEAHMVYGVYDIIAKISGNNMNSLKDLITNKIRRIDNIQNTITIMVEEPENKA
jgi:DNA-binding Lrp family transcriptional regulator